MKCWRTRPKPASKPRSRASPNRPTCWSSTRPAATIRSPARRSSRPTRLVTPMNDSFVDLDLIGQVHPENFKVTKPSFYAELIWNSRTQRAKETGKSVDWVVLRNRLQHISSHNLQRVGAALDELARRVGYPRHPRPWRARHLPRAVPQGPDPARPRRLRRSRHWTYCGPPGVARNDRGAGRSGRGRDRGPAQGGRRGLSQARQQGIHMSHQFNRTILREYDVRGIVGQTLHRRGRLRARPQLCRAGRVGRREAGRGRPRRAHPFARAGGGAGRRADRRAGSTWCGSAWARRRCSISRCRRSTSTAASRSPAATIRPTITASRCC